MLKNFDEIIAAAQKLETKKIAVAVAQSVTILEAAAEASKLKIADFILVGNGSEISDLAKHNEIDLNGFEIINEPDKHMAAYKAAKLVSGGEADLLMKGNIDTADFLRAVLTREAGLKTGQFISHAMVVEAHGAERLFIITDVGINIAPSLKQKADIIQNAAAISKILGVSPAKVAVLAAIELVNPDMPVTMEAAILAKMAVRPENAKYIIGGNPIW